MEVKVGDRIPGKNSGSEGTRLKRSALIMGERDVQGVHEDIVPLRARDEPKTLRIIEPLDRSLAPHRLHLLSDTFCSLRLGFLRGPDAFGAPGARCPAGAWRRGGCFQADQIAVRFGPGRMGLAHARCFPTGLQPAR